MITTGRTQARDEIHAIIRDAILGAGYLDEDVIWQDDLQPRDVDTVVFSVNTQFVTGEQVALRGDGLTRRRQVEGILHAIVRVPVAGGLTIADNLSTILENALFGKTTPNGVWFKNVIGREVPAKDGNTQVEISADFIYQELV